MKGALVETPLSTQGEGGLQEDSANKRNNNGLQNRLDLRLGISFNNGVESMVTSSTGISDGKGGVGGGPSPSTLLGTQDGLSVNQRKRWFSETGGGFIDPWSLAGRQEKAVLEQAHQKLKSSSFLPRASHTLPPPPPPPPPPPTVVGWPPVRSFRKNIGASQLPKIEGDEEKTKNKEKKLDCVNNGHKLEPRTTMYVKVNIDGFAVGRKIDLKAHDSYDSLSLALQKMFHNFLCANYSNNLKQDKGEEIVKPGYILLYQDNEGDCLLVGDVPWEMFMTSVKRLYIVRDPRTQKEADRRMVESEKQASI